MLGAGEMEDNRFSVPRREVTFRSQGPLGQKIAHFAHEFDFRNIQVHELRRRVRKYTEGGKLDPACGKIARRK